MPRAHISAKPRRGKLLYPLGLVSRHRALFAPAILAAVLFISPRTTGQEQESGPPAEEMLANLDAGRVVIGVAKDGVVIATLENPIEPDTRPPEIIPLFGQRAAILLGAADWWLPELHRELANLSQELPTLPSPLGVAGPHLETQSPAGQEATDIEQVAERLHMRLNWIVRQIHGNLHWKPNAPILEMLLADYAPDYGPEVWLIHYAIDQQPLQGDYWQSRALQPLYTQLWPPAKGQPHTLMEVDFPRDTAGSSIDSLLASGDPRIAKVASSSPEFQNVAEAILNGDLKKVTAVDLAAFLRASLHAIAMPKARMIEAEINEKQGIGWFIPPPPQPNKPGAEPLRPPGAPSLRQTPAKPHGPGAG